MGHFVRSMFSYFSGNARNTPYSKMAANKLFFCLHVNEPSLPRQHVSKTKEFAYKHANKRIIY